MRLIWFVFYKDSPHLLEKGNTKYAESILAPIINPVYGNTVTNSVYADVVCFSFKDDDFPPWKHSSSANVSKNNNQSAAVQKVIIHNSVNSFVVRKPVSVV